MSKVKIEIKNRWSGNILFEYEKENNSLKETVIEAIRQEADLRGANLCGANLYEADLREADLREADLRGANLCGANLYEADLREADLRGADLYRADLCEANLCEADLCGAIIYHTDGIILEIQNYINKLIDNTSIEQMEVYENHNQIFTRWNAMWKNVLVVKNWTLKDKKQEPIEMTLAEVCEKLGYEVKVII